MRVLDLFCGAGGASAGYARAGHEVVGVDLNPKVGAHYPYRFVEGDAIAILRDGAEGYSTLAMDFDFIHASPPCQPFTRGQKLRRGKPSKKVDLVDETRYWLERLGTPFVIENVEGAPLRDPVVLCGSSFGLKVRRHRLFEAGNGFVLAEPPACDHKGQGRPVGVYHKMNDQVKGINHKDGTIVYGGRTAATIEEAQEAMGIDWMTWREMCESIPPAYTEWIGRQIG